MKEKLISLIKNSGMLKDSQKLMYIAMLDGLSEARMAELLAVFEKESSIKKEIDSDVEKKISDANREYIVEAKNAYEEEKAEVAALIKDDDSKKADELISNL